MLWAFRLRLWGASTLAPTRLATSTIMDSLTFSKLWHRQELRVLLTFEHLLQTAHPSSSPMAFLMVLGCWSLPPLTQRPRAAAQETCSVMALDLSSIRAAHFS